MSRRARFLLAMTALATTLVFAAPAHAEDAWGADVAVMSDTEMSDLRGGIDLGNGLQVGLGAVITTYANGIPALQTMLTWSDAGAVVSETLGDLGQRLDTLTPEQRTAMGLDGLTGVNGVVISDSAGVTALAHNITNGALQNIIINNATGRDLSQTVDVTLTLPGFEGMQQQITQQLTGLRLSDDMRGVAFGPR